MTRPRNRSKLSEVEKHENVDRISSLPDELLGYMLSFLPTTCAVGTSVLSSRWRYLHLLTNCLSFYVPLEYHEEEFRVHKESFNKFMNRILLFNNVSSIKNFHLNCGRLIYLDSQHHAWISAAIMKGVEHLHLSFPGHFTGLPQCLFYCQTIVELKLDSRIEDLRVPEASHLPNLKILHLRDLTFFDEDSFCYLFSACPLLQELNIEYCFWPMASDCYVSLCLQELKRLKMICCKGHQIEVDAPSLAYLEYTSIEVALSLKYPVRLVTAHLSFPFIDTSNSIELALSLIKASHHVKKLYLLRNVVQYLTRCEDDHIPSYPNLVEFRLGYCSYDTWKHVMYWLGNSLQLETIIFQQLIKVSTQSEKWPPNAASLVPFSSCVKVIEVYNFRGYTTELVLLEYLLRNAKELKRLVLYKDRHAMTKKQELLTSRKLLMLPRASTNCVVQLRKPGFGILM